jgi:hypothetical protein
MIDRSSRRFGWPLLVGAAALAATLAGCASPSTPSPSPAETSPVAPPAPLAGEWGVQIKFFEHPVDGVLRFSTSVRGAPLGSFTDDEGNQSELEELKVDGARISFKLETRDGTISAHGQIAGTIISGKMKLKRNDEESGFGVSGGGASHAGPGGRRVGESDTYAWTAIKRAAPVETPR